MTSVASDTIAMLDYVRQWNDTDSTMGSINSANAPRGVSMGNHANRGATALLVDGSARFNKLSTWMLDYDYRVTDDMDLWQYNYGSMGVHVGFITPSGALYKADPDYR